MEKSNKKNLWKALDNHALSFNLYPSKTSKINNEITNNTLNVGNITLDYSKQNITHETLELLIKLAKSCHIEEKIYQLIHGGIVNLSEQRPALHTALREHSSSFWINDENIMVKIFNTQQKMQNIVEKIRTKNWLGFAKEPISDIVNIGIGGSDLGAKFCLDVLEDYTLDTLTYHFINDADPESFERIIKKLRRETTLFIISSKSFTTKETLYNAKKAIQWIGKTLNYQQHFIAVTANSEKAQAFGIHNILPIWDWVGGRYSFSSAINLITAIAIGFDNFQQMLAGANLMDKNFQNTTLANNLPVLLALIGVWNNNFLNIHNLLLLTYARKFKHFVPYIQQLEMESNGKSIDNQGRAVNYATAPLIWGGDGNQAQHSYFQLLCQGTHKFALDVITLDKYSGEMIHDICNSTINVLHEGVNEKNNPNGFIPGNISINNIRISEITPFSIGSLIALYEHKVFTQSVIWDINPFDQPGVESAKRVNHVWKEPFISDPFELEKSVT